MGACSSSEQDETQRQLQKVPLKTALAQKRKTVGGDGAPVMVLDFDMTLTCLHCGKTQLTEKELGSLTPEMVFDSPPGRLRSLQNFLSDLKHEVGCEIIILTLNTHNVVLHCLRLGGLDGFVTEVISCNSRSKGKKLVEICNRYTPCRLVFADDDRKNIADAKANIINASILPLSSGSGLQPRHLEWLYYAAKGELSYYNTLVH